MTDTVHDGQSSLRSTPKLVAALLIAIIGAVQVRRIAKRSKLSRSASLASAPDDAVASDAAQPTAMTAAPRPQATSPSAVVSAEPPLRSGSPPPARNDPSATPTRAEPEERGTEMASSQNGEDDRRRDGQQPEDDDVQAGATGQPTDTGARPDLDDDDPDSPTELSAPSLFAVLKRVRQQIGEDGLTDLAAALTYYAVLSIVPGLVVLISILGLLGPDTTTEVSDQVSAIAPGSSAAFVHTLIAQAQANKGGAGLSAVLGVVVALWSASGYVAAFMRASNVVYGIGEGRPIWKTVPIRLGVTITAVILLVLSAVIVVVSGPVAHQIGTLLGAGDTTVRIWNIAKWPVLLIIVSVLLAILFWASPNAKQAGIKWVSPGGVIAVLIWLIISGLFAVYVSTFASYNKTYGSLAGVVIFLVWLWLSNLAILLGAEVNAELDHAKAIAQGLPEDAQPFAEPRDTRKLDDQQKRAIDDAQAARRG